MNFSMIMQNENMWNAKLFYMGTGRFIFHVNIDDIYKYIAEDVETRFDTSLTDHYLNQIIKKVNGLMMK